MSVLEKKFYDWLMLNYCVPIKPEKIAKELAEIAGKHYVNCDKCLELCKENIELKQQYDNEREWKLIYSKENAELKKQKGVVIAEGIISSGYYGFSIDNEKAKTYKNIVDIIYKFAQEYKNKKGKLIFLEDNK